ncbi:50S ribosomal protein L10 [Tardisphaera miroshnichenkoae]
MPSQQILLKKQKLASDLAEKIKKYNSVMIIGIQGANDKMLSELRSRLRGLAEVKVAKNSTVVRALTSLKEERHDIEKLAALATGTNALIISNTSPFILSTIIDEIKDSDWIKPGMPSPVDVVIPAGDLGLPPGGPASVLTDMGAKIKIVKGMIRLDEDFTLIHAKEKPSAAAASLLMALDIKPIPLSFQIKGAWDGVFIPGEQLHISIDEYEKDLVSAKLNALAVAVEAEIMNDETAPLILQKAAIQAYALAGTGAFFSPKEMEVAIKRAATSATVLKNSAGI